MNTVHDRPSGELYPAGHSRKPVNFYCAAPRAKAVHLTGNFNHWQTMRMHPRDDGWWFVQVVLTHGPHQYHFLVDGQPMLDPQALGSIRDNDNNPVSVIAVN